KGEDVAQPGIPQSFHVLMKELQSLVLSIELENDDVKEDQGLGSNDDLFSESPEISDPLALLEGTLNSNSSEPDRKSETNEEPGSIEDDQPVPGGDD
ncbi:MAG TPA: hypothetical protein DCS57_02010, partial [Dehalococcoidia bacterium]|nr:hypothetical protein [Dehalococcoidia bacterium]